MFTLGALNDAGLHEILYVSNRNSHERAGSVTVLCIRNGSKWNDSNRIRTDDRFYTRA